MESSSWIAIYMPLFIIFLVIIPQQTEVTRSVINRLRKKRRDFQLDNELIRKFIGKECRISTGSYGSTVVGTITDVKENWIEVQTRKGMELVNADFIHNVKVK